MFIEIFEKFSDIGKLSDKELKKGKACIHATDLE